jgi:AAA15 family ATPase/GTPase
MLIEFTFENYRSFKAKQTLTFAGDSEEEGLKGNYIPLEEALNCNKEELRIKSLPIVKVLALFGANASGKTNVLNALSALQNMVESSAKKVSPDEKIQEIDAFAGNESNPTSFEVKFALSGECYHYKIAATRESIIFESLKTLAVKKNSEERILFIREKKENDNSYTWEGEFKEKEITSRTLPNVLFLSKLIAENIAEKDKEMLAVFNWFNDTLDGINTPLNTNITSELFLENKEFTQKIKDFLITADIGVRDVQIKKNEEILSILDRISTEEKNKLMPYLEQYKINLIHEVEGKKFPFHWGLESKGTQVYFSLIGPLLHVLENGRILYIDEFETSLHPALQKELIKLFLNRDTNPKNAQIVFTTHNPLIWDESLLRRDQFWLTRKDDGGQSTLYPLLSKGIEQRYSETILNGYLSGRFGGIPNIKIRDVNFDNMLKTKKNKKQ